jgi:hypothetical protein
MPRLIDHTYSSYPINRGDFLSVEHDAEMFASRIEVGGRVDQSAVLQGERYGHDVTSPQATTPPAGVKRRYFLRLRRNQMAALLGLAADLQVIFVLLVLLQRVTRCRLRLANEVKRNRLVGVAPWHRTAR